MRFIKFVVGLVLLPCAWGAILSLVRAVELSVVLDRFWVPFCFGILGFAILFFWVPKPVWLYVVGHELTHALWVVLFGGKVQKIKATSRGGHVIVSKSNFIIALAPYFFPLYSCVLIAGFGLARLFIEWSLLPALFYVLLGFTVGFHFLMNLEVLKIRQPDWAEHGFFFSGVVVVLGNVLVFGFALSCLRGMQGIKRYGMTLVQEFVGAYGGVIAFVRHLVVGSAT